MPQQITKSEPLRFDSLDSLKRDLASSHARTWTEDFLSRPKMDLERIVRSSIDQSTYRAFPLRQFGLSPGNLYREWCNAYLSAHASDIVAVRNTAGMQTQIAAAASSLMDTWSRATDRRHEIGFGRAAKLINLTLKHLVLWRELAERDQRRLWGSLHVALDRYTLQPIARLAPEFGLSSNASMGIVKSERQYWVLQEWIASVCADAGVPPITYEILAFNIPKRIWSGPATELRVPATPRTTEIKRGLRRKEAPGKLQSTERRPHTDHTAAVVRRREVDGVPVVHAPRATYRNAIFSGVLEVADEELGKEFVSGRGPRVFRCKLGWFGWEPQNGFAKVAVTEGWQLTRSYSGEVVAELGRAPE